MKTLLLPLFLMVVVPLQAQSVLERINSNLFFAASNYQVYPDSIQGEQTPPPAGKRPFYISHYGRHGSRYLNSMNAYITPYEILSEANKKSKLTQLGFDLMEQLGRIIHDSHGRWGDLTPLGQQQHRNIARRMMQNYPEIFAGNAHIQARSTTVNRCILSMGSALQQFVALNPQLRIDLDASHADMCYMNFQDKLLRDSMMTKKAKKAYKAYYEKRSANRRIMELLFNDTAYISHQVNTVTLTYYLLKTELVQQNTQAYNKVTLRDLFTQDELYRFWQSENAWWYIMYGPSLLNGGNEPYTQRHLLRKLITDADSCIALPRPGAQLRFGHETMVLPLTCLLGLNGYDFQTMDLEEIESHGWWASLVFPMAANLQFVFYRQHADDHDVIFKVLLNEKEATLPITTDIAPYYHWKDFRDFYLRKLDNYEKIRAQQ